MFTNQETLEVHFRKQHPGSPSPKATPQQPAVQSSPTPGEEPEEDAIIPTPKESARMAPQDEGQWEEVWQEFVTEKSIQTYTEEVDWRDKKHKRTETNQEAEKAAGDDKEKDLDYVQSEEGSSMDPLYEPTRKELKRADRERDK